MVWKPYKHFNSGNTIRRKFIKESIKTMGSISVKRHGKAKFQHKFDLLDGLESDITYSQSKRNRWRLLEQCQAQLLSADDDDDDAEVEEDDGESVVIMEHKRYMFSGPHDKHSCIEFVTNQENGHKRHSKKEGHQYLNSDSLTKQTMIDEGIDTDDLMTQHKGVTHVVFKTPGFYEGTFTGTVKRASHGNNEFGRESGFHRRHNGANCDLLSEVYSDIDDDDSDFCSESFQSKNNLQESITNSLISHPDTAQYFKSSAEPTDFDFAEALSQQKTIKKNKKQRRKKPTANSKILEKFKYRENENDDNIQVPEDCDTPISDPFPVSGQTVTICMKEKAKDVLMRTLPDQYQESQTLPKLFMIDLTPDLIKIWNLWAPIKHIACITFENANGDVDDQQILLQKCDVVLNVCLKKNTTLRQIVFSCERTFSLDEIIKECLHHITQFYTKDSFSLDACIQHNIPTLTEELKYPLINQKALIPAWINRQETTIKLPEETAVLVGKAGSMTEDDKLICIICCQPLYEEIEDSEFDITLVSYKDVTIQPCQHTFCKSCFTEHLLRSIKLKKELLCPGYNCESEVDFTTCVSFVSLHLYAWYWKLRRQEKIHWCPTPQCNRPLRYIGQEESTKSVRCLCSFSFCLLCHGENHWPADCDSAKIYIKQLKGDPDTEITLRLHSSNRSGCPAVLGRHCPHCKVFMVKIGGCKRMKCICQKSFCWNCGSKKLSCNCFVSGERMGNIYRKLVDVQVDYEKGSIFTASEKSRELYKQAVNMRKKQYWNSQSKEKYLNEIKRFCDSLIKDKKNLKPDEVAKCPELAENVISTLCELRRIIEFTFVKAVFCNSRHHVRFREFGNRLSLLDHVISHLIETNCNISEYCPANGEETDKSSTRLQTIQEKFREAGSIINQMEKML